MAMVDWNSIAPRLCGQTMETAAGWAHWVAWRGLVSRKLIARMLKPTSETSWMMLMAMARLVEPVMPRTAIHPTTTENAIAIRICTYIGALMLNWPRM